MKIFSLRRTALCGIAFAVSLVLAAPVLAQRGGGGLGAYGSVQQTPPAPKVNPIEEKDYKVFYAITDNDKKIQAGNDFLQKYPTTVYLVGVYNQLVNAYNAKQDGINFYATADKAIAMDPDDVDVLAIEGWVIPHLYKADDPDAQKKLERSEQYERHVVELVPKMTKPADATEEDFAKAKTEKLTEAHSALGLDYFRLQDFENSVKELQLSTQGTSAPDQADFYVLGMGQVQLQHFSDAADAFQKCSQMTGSLSDRCKQQMDGARKQVK